MSGHPIRDLPILTYIGSADCIAFIGDGSRYSYPYFRGSSTDEAAALAEEFRAKVIADHEAAYLNRIAGREKAAETRAKKTAGAAA